MPPKRKRVEDGAPAESSSLGRSTRSSTRAKGAASEPAPAKQTKKTAKAAAVQAEVAEDEPAPKRKKTTKATSKTTGRGKKKAGSGDDEPPTAAQSQSTAVSQRDGMQGHALTKPTVPPPQPAKPKSLKSEAYTPKNALELFAQYADSDNVDVIGPEGFEQLFTDAEIPMDGALPLILAWQMNASEMAKISKEEWIKGTGALKISSLNALSVALNDLQNLLISKEPPLKKAAKSDQDPYDRTSYFSYASNSKTSFHKFYSFCFALAKPEGSRNIDMETAAAFWSVLLVPQYPIMQEIVDFVNEKKDTYRATNKDLWGMMLEFCETVKPTLEDYEADGAWPTLLDDFVLWKKTNHGTNPNGI